MYALNKGCCGGIQMEIKNVELRELTAPCGLDCFNCVFYLANDNEAARRQVESFTQQFGVVGGNY